jgi:menaquinone-specific isochorismate synthase
MITYFRSNAIYSPPDLQLKIQDLITQLPRMISTIGTPLQILRYEFNCTRIAPLTWLHNQASPTKIYFSERDQSFEMAGIDAASELKSSKDLSISEMISAGEDHFCADNPYLRYYGGICFDTQNMGEEWQAFSKARFIIPQFELCRREGETIFAFNIALKDISEENIPQILARFKAIDFSTETRYRKVPRIISRTDIPERASWEKIFSEVKNNLQLQKIVLARRTDFIFDVEIRPSALIKHLKDQTPSCYHYCFQFDERLGFLGASPECLYKRNNLAINTEALAGTTKRGTTPVQDEQLAQELLHSDKNTSEHKYVVDAIRESLAGLCESFDADTKMSVLKLNEAQHLLTRFSGNLRPNTTDDQILKNLHPTPALAGVPRHTVIDTIRQKEPFRRGWYAGAVGYLGFNHAHFAAAIRCGLVHENCLSLYAGAGIVHESQMTEEWHEIENKISRFMKIFETENKNEH